MRPQRNEDYQPGALVRAWHKQETGGMQIPDIIKAPTVREVLGRAVNLFRPRRPRVIKLQQIESPRTEEVDIAGLDLSTLYEAEQHQEQEVDEDWMTAPTVLMPAIRPARRPEPVSLPDASLPLDERGRPYLLLQSNARTEDLVREGVARFHALVGLYPSIILLSLPRYKANDAAYYIINHVSIPMDCEGLREYDVLFKRY